MPRGRPSRAARQDRTSLSEISIPDKLYFRIGEVSELAQTKPYVLRYWETEFSALRPVKSKSGHRLYRRQDVETVFEIRRLLYERGFTIEGARRQLRDNSQASEDHAPAQRAATDGAHLRAIKRELEDILTLLSRKC